MSILIYRDPKAIKKNSWVKFLLYRIKQNKNNLITVTGKTGSGKTWSAISVCEMMSEQNKIPFGIGNIIFTLKDLMVLINSNKLKKGSCVIFDEPQISISNREFQSEANKVFNYLMSTFRHRNLTLFFCTPFEDLLDKTCRKLFHAKFTTTSINRNTKMCKLKPVEIEYNSTLQKFYYKFLRIQFKPKDKSHYVVVKLKSWLIPKPSQPLIDLYEEKKLAFTSKLNKTIQNRLEAFEKEQEAEIKGKLKETRKPLTKKQEEVLRLVALHKDVKRVAKILGTSLTNIYKQLKLAKKKGYGVSEYIENEA